MSPLVLGEVIVVFVKRLTADGKYALQDCEKLKLPIQMQLPRKRKRFLEFLVPFLESISTFEGFEKKYDCHS